MAETTGKRRKSWHESKHLRKRAAFLLENLDLIPTDVCFRIMTNDEKVEEVHGHKIFFALASPIFYAMFYGLMKEEGDVEIEDVSIDAFRCLQKYIYTDSFDEVNVANVVHVLAASKKYMIAKLTRHCYGFIQNNITAENSVSLWSQARNIFDETVAEQCVAEIRRNTTKAVLAESFLKMPQDQLLELTSWQRLTINETDLFEATKRWTLSRKRTGVSCKRSVGGAFQNIRFALMDDEKLVLDQFIWSEVFTQGEREEIYGYKRNGVELRSFNPRIRDPVLSSFQLSIQFYGPEKKVLSGDMGPKFIQSVNVLIWADVAPKACQLLRHYVQNGYGFTVRQTSVGPGIDVSFVRQKKNEVKKLGEEALNVEKKTGLWDLCDSVLLDVDKSGPVLVLRKTSRRLKGEQPDDVKRIEEAALPVGGGGESAIVVGKVQSVRPDTMYAFNVLGEDRTGDFFTFDCSLKNV